MSETTTPAQQPGGPAPQQPLVVNIQYVKDLSFEVPGAPQIYAQMKAQPQGNINLDVQARRIQDGQNVFEVAIVIRAEAHDTSPQANGQAAPVPPTVMPPPTVPPVFSPTTTAPAGPVRLGAASIQPYPSTDRTVAVTSPAPASSTQSPPWATAPVSSIDAATSAPVIRASCSTSSPPSAAMRQP